MSAHWRLALRNTVWIAVLAVPVAVVVYYFYGMAYAGAFLYGVAGGTVSLVSTALTVTLLMGRSMAGGMMIGGASFGARFGFAVAALGIPAYLELWPVAAMLGGFAGVYVAENVVLLPVMMKALSNPDMGYEHQADRKAERRVEG